MTKKEPKTQSQSRLSTWLFGQPAKFSIMVLGCALLAGMLYSIITAIISPDTINSDISPLPMTVLVFMVGLFSAYRLIKKLPNASMDRHSFILVANGALFFTCVAILVNMMLMTHVLTAIQATPVPHPTSGIGILFAIILIALMSMYILGVTISMLYATYLRARNMGVSRIRAILSMPFSMFLLAGYLIPEKPARRTAITTRTTFYDTFITWVSNNRFVSWVMCALIFMAFGLIFGFSSMLFVMPIPLIIFGIWYISVGGDTIRKNIDGKFGTVAVIINILMIVLTIGMTTIKTQPQQAAESITISETVAAPVVELELNE